MNEARRQKAMRWGRGGRSEDLRQRKSKEFWDCDKKKKEN